MPTMQSLLCLVHANKRNATSASPSAVAASESLSGDLWCNGQREPCRATPDGAHCFSIRVYLAKDVT
jgi:hypothetical protein